MSGPPKFDFFPDDWLAGTRTLTPSARGCYIDLLAFQWSRGYIPETPAERRLLCGVSDATEWEVVWQQLARKFVPVNSGDLVDTEESEISRIVLVNPKMHEQRQYDLPKYLERKEISRKNGAKGGRPKTQELTQEKPSNKPDGFEKKTQIRGGRYRESAHGAKAKDNALIGAPKCWRQVHVPQRLKEDGEFMASWNAWGAFCASRYDANQLQPLTFEMQLQEATLDPATYRKRIELTIKTGGSNQRPRVFDLDEPAAALPKLTKTPPRRT